MVYSLAPNHHLNYNLFSNSLIRSKESMKNMFKSLAKVKLGIIYSAY